MLIGTDGCVCVVFMWEETRVTQRKPTWCPHDHLTCDAGYQTNVAAARGESFTTVE